MYKVFVKKTIRGSIVTFKTDDAVYTFDYIRHDYAMYDARHIRGLIRLKLDPIDWCTLAGYNYQPCES